MTFRFRCGDLLGSDKDTLVNTVNCVGVMGKGIALDFKNRHPEMYRDYVQRCRRQEVHPGAPYIYPEPRSSEQLALDLSTSPQNASGPKIINFPTKQHWRGRSRLEYVAEGLQRLEADLTRWGVQSLAIPPLGCGNGGLDWCEVGPMIVDFAMSVVIPVDIYVPAGVDPLAPFGKC